MKSPTVKYPACWKAFSKIATTHSTYHLQKFLKDWVLSKAKLIQLAKCCSKYLHVLLLVWPWATNLVKRMTSFVSLVWFGFSNKIRWQTLFQLILKKIFFWMTESRTANCDSLKKNCLPMELPTWFSKKYQTCWNKIACQIKIQWC